MKWLAIAGVSAIGLMGLPVTSAAQNLFFFSEEVTFVSKNGNPAPFNTAEVGDVIIIQASVQHEQGAAQALAADGKVFINLGFDTIDLGTFTTPPIPAGTSLPITLVPNSLLPNPPVDLGGGKFQWEVTAPSPWLHVFTFEITTPDSNSADNIATLSLDVAQGVAQVPALGLLGMAALVVALLALPWTRLKRERPLRLR